MQLFTYLQLKTLLKKEMDLEEETFVQEDELVGYFNQAIDQAEAEILTLYEDYFLAESTISLVSGTSEYSLPSGCYATKIRALIYSAGVGSTRVYEVRPLKKSKKFLTVEMLRAYSTANATEFYNYFIKNDSSTAGYKIVLLPTPLETNSNLKIYFIRNANRIPLVTEGSQAATDATVVDIPEFYTFLIQQVKLAIMAKEGDARYNDQVNRTQYERKMLVDTLAKMVVDDNDLLDQDQSIYEEHS